MKVALLEAGADGYITKPFCPAELLARINVAFRHHRSDIGDTLVFTSGDLTIDLPNRVVKKSGKVIHFTNTEFQFLAVLVKNAGQVVPQDQILREVWGPTAIESPHYLRIYASQLRKKVEGEPSLPRHIITEPGKGYRIV